MLGQLFFVGCFCVPVLICSFVERIILAVPEFGIGLGVIDLVQVMTAGFMSDLTVMCYVVPLPLILLLSFDLRRIYVSRKIKNFVFVLVFFHASFWVWACLSECYFWQDFSTRFNFIAVDYLVYTKEVVGNIAQSFSMTTVLGGWGIGSLILGGINIKLMGKVLRRYHAPCRRIELLPFALLPLLAWGAVDVLPYINFNHPIHNELAKNGVYEFFSAFHSNELDFETLYAHLSDARSLEIAHQELSAPGVELVSGSGKQWVKLPLEASLTQRRYNLIMIAVESLGARFIGKLGNTKGITPYLDALSDKSLFFTNLYATGTRTVRGLEALTLSLPPTPGASIVRRKKNKGMMSIGGVLKSVGYETKFIYGGHGIFDNMNRFFRKNGYQIVDRTDMAEDEHTFTNAWGVADENLFLRVLRESDLSHAKKKPFFSMVLTTSNHRPFTYPHGKIDIPSHTGREGAVKYTDYAIGKFLEEAAKKAWFKNTLIVIVADHSADGRGVIDVPVETYHIPMWIYAPELIPPRKVSTVASQIDVIPTVLELMKVRVPTMFMGRDILNMTTKDERFFAGTYQKVGMYSNGVFSSLGPKGVVESHAYDPLTRHMIRTRLAAPTQEERTIGLYQYASRLYSKQLYQLEEVVKKEGGR